MEVIVIVVDFPVDSSDDRQNLRRFDEAETLEPENQNLTPPLDQAGTQNAQDDEEPGNDDKHDHV